MSDKISNKTSSTKIFLALLSSISLINSIKSQNEAIEPIVTTKDSLMSINIGISPENRKEIARILNTVLADEFVLYTKTLNFHWNVVGSNFAEYHKFLNDQYEKLQGIVDDIAERVRSLDGTALGSNADFIKIARIKEHAGATPSEGHIMEALANDHEAIIRTLRQDAEAVGTKYQDAGTANFLTDLMEKHEKFAWMLRSFNQK